MPTPSRPSHSTIVAYLALFVALGGSAYAAATIGSSDIKRDAVKSKHIRDGKVKSVDVEDDGLTGGDIDEGTLGTVPNASAVGSVASGDLFQRGTNNPAQQLQGANFYSYFANTGQSQAFGFGQIELRTNGTPGQFQVCKPAAAANSFISVVLYVNGVRSTTSVTAPNECTTAFDAGAGGDFEVSARRVRIFGLHSGDGAANENYSLLGIGQL